MRFQRGYQASSRALIGDGRDDRHARSTAPGGWGCEHRPHHAVDDDARRPASDLQDVTGSSSKTQQKLSSGKELTTPSDDPYRRQPGAAVPQRPRAEPAVPAQRRRGDRPGRTSTDTALGEISDVVLRARDLARPGRERHATPASDRAVDRARDRPADRLGQDRGQRPVRRPLRLRRHRRRSTQPVPAWRRRRLRRRHRGRSSARSGRASRST